MYKSVFCLLIVSFFLFSCKKQKTEKKDFVNVVINASVGRDNTLSFTFFNGGETLYSEKLIGQNKTSNGVNIGTNKDYSFQIPIEKTGNLIVEYGNNLKTQENGAATFQVMIDNKFYFAENVITISNRKNITLK
jgi:thioredoxin-related protein